MQQPINFHKQGTPLKNQVQEIPAMSRSSSQIITCRAVVCWEANEAPKMEEIQVDPPKSGEVRVKMLFASLCHTDVLGCKGFPSPVFPRVLGHEGVGMVESIGEGVTKLREGDIVIPTYLGRVRGVRKL
ncbi:Alcohol dehydrogenase class-P [Abeliophyllum distichum]|uniref:Alcohol dehydrogenase class-P n=1 Tax=Abeliophyllum distichum TaxID=126358 RepID=A0ABD1VYF8_9LAMI